MSADLRGPRESTAPGGGIPEPPSVESTSEIQVVHPADWDELLARLGGTDTYFHVAYHQASALLEPPGSTPALLHYRSAGEEIALPLLLRPLPDGSGWDATSAYGYGGPVGHSGRGVAAFGAALDAWARENDVVATFLRLHPLLGNVGLVPDTAVVHELGHTVAWDVSPGRDLASLMHPHHRRAMRRAERAGLEVRICTTPSTLDEFRRLYHVTMQRRRAESYYYFPAAYWDALLDHAVELGLLLVEGRIAGELVAGMLCFHQGAWMHYHLGASSDAGRTIGASTRCFLAVAEWAQTRGMTTFHLGGGLSSNSDQLFEFKRRHDPHSPLRFYHIAKLVHEPRRYARLAGTHATIGFFPPWRRIQEPWPPGTPLGGAG